LLTDAAQIALPALREAFDRLAEAASMLTAAVDGRRLSLTAAPSFAAKWLVPRLGKFEEAHPQVDVWLSAGMDVVDFAANEIDLAIRYGGGRYPGLEARANRYLPILKGTFSFFIGGLAVLLLLEAWGLDAFAWFGQGRLGARLLSSVISIAITLTIALLVWEAAA
jgi:hypothetical protein